MKTISDGVDVVQIVSLGILALLPMLTRSLVRFAIGETHRWDFIEGLAKAAATVVVTFNVCVIAWYVMKFVDTPDFATVTTCVLGVVWYLCWGFLTCVLFPAFSEYLHRWADSES